MVTYIEKLIWQNSFNLMPNNLEILVIQHFRPAVLLFTGGGSCIFKTALSQRHVQKDLQECLYINCSCITLPLVSYCINFFSCRDSREHWHDPGEP